MPENDAKILRFPRRQEPSRSPEEARTVAKRYLEMAVRDRSDGFVLGCLSEPETLLAICALLKDLRNTTPSTVVEEAARIYGWFVADHSVVGVFDEREYFIGDVAFLVGSACRLLGRREEAELWLDRAEAGFRHTVNPAPLLANVAYERLALHYDMRRFERVFELLPSLTASFQKLNMKREVLKCRFLEAASLKDSERRDEAQERFEGLKSEPLLDSDATLRGLVLANLGEILSTGGRHAEAVSVYQEALSFQSQSSQPLVAAHLKVAIAEGLREEGHLRSAAESYRAAISDYTALGMLTSVAYIRILAAETLIASARHREAEWEILAALPIIEDQKMVPEGLAAVALLNESVRRRKTDPSALRELREHLQANR